MSEEKNNKSAYLFLGIIGVLAFFFRLYPYYGSRGRLILFVICATIAYFVWYFFRSAPTLHPAFPLEFANHPEKFDRKFITIEGRVVKIFTDTVAEGFKRKLIDIFRTIIGSKNFKGRYSHLRFLIEAPKLRSHQYILVEHNLKFGRPWLRYGSVVELKGEYIHPEKSNAKNFYGKIHSTHEPKGFLRKI